MGDDQIEVVDGDSRLDEWITKLEKNLIKSQEEIERLKAQQQEAADRNRKVQEATNAVNSKNPARRIQGARDLARYAGAGGVDALIYLMQTDRNYDVRIAAANALGSLGRAARGAVRHLQGLLAQPPYEPPINATREQLEMQMKDGDYRKAMHDALRRIQG